MSTTNENPRADILKLIVPFGSRDIYAANQAIDEFCLDEDEVADYIEEYMNDCEAKFADLDICALVYDFALQQVRREIEDLIDKDIQNDYSFDVYGNYMCSEFQYKDEELEEIKDLLKDCEKSDTLQAWLDSF